MGKGNERKSNAVEAFYSSWVWRRAKDAYRKEKIFCERCGAPGQEVHHKIRLTAKNVGNPEISLNPKNFELLCWNCHHKDEHGAKWRTDPDGHVTLDSPP